MKIRLLPEHEAFVREKVESGEYDSADDVVTDALFCFQHIEQFRALRREELRGEIQVGLDEADRGELEEADEVLNRIEQKLRGRDAAAE